MSVASNIRKIKEEIPGNVTLVAVSKTKPNEDILEAYEDGQLDFGENKVQDLSAKAEVLPNDIRWHFIGHLQTNKVKYIAAFVHLIHAVDSMKLLKEINKRAAQNERTIDVLLQMHIAEEESKFGLDENEIDDLINSSDFQSLSNVRIRGLMAMATNTDQTEKVRLEFQRLRKKYLELDESMGLDILSMGMTNDYKIALEEGSNMIRIGSLIFGPRNL